MEGYFFNDLVAFDLNALQQSANRWEILIQNTIDGGPPHGQVPPARTNHTMVTWGDKLYLFGGTDGVHWFNDVWSYSPHTNSWTQLECIGYIPSPREGHAAALVGDVMYIFGGRTEEGNDLGDLAAFRISSRRWYTFQNMGPSPSPRSGHSMTTVGKQIVVLAGEPSSAPRDPVELGLAYFLDTNKIRYPADSGAPPPTNQQQLQNRRPSGETGNRPMGLQQNRGIPPPGQQQLAERSNSAAENRVRSPDNGGSRLPRAAQPAPTGPPPQAPGQQPLGQQTRGPNGVTSPTTTRPPTRTPERGLSPTNEPANKRFGEKSSNSDLSRNGSTSGSTAAGAAAAIPSLGYDATPEQNNGYDRGETLLTRSGSAAKAKPETYQPSSSDPNTTVDAYGRTIVRGSVPGANNSHHDEPVTSARKISEEVERAQDSGLGSSPALTVQYDLLARELEQARQKNAWYASELALARKSGYQSRDSPVLDERNHGSNASVDGTAFADDDRPLVEALLQMRAELARVQEHIDDQSRQAAERIAEMEKQRDVAIAEAVFAKARLAGQPGGGGSPRLDGVKDDPKAAARSDDVSRRLASSLEANAELQHRVDALTQSVEAEKRARELAEETAEAAQKRVAELDAYRQQHAAEVELLRAELHETQKEAREATAAHSELDSRHQLLNVDHEEIKAKFQSAITASTNHTAILATLKEAVAASEAKAALLQGHLEEERLQRSEIERTHRELKVAHETRAAELEQSARQLHDAQALAEQHAEEARTHRAAVLAGLGQVTERDGVAATGAQEQRLQILQQQVETAAATARKHQAAADAASEKLRRAEERIAGLEAYQEQASREGLSIRKQLQASLKENHGLTTEKAALEQRLERHKLETNALSVQHASLKDILGERGVNASEVRRSRALDSPSSARFSTPDPPPGRLRELELNYEGAVKAQEELRREFEDVSERSDKMKRDYEEKLSALDNDHQAAVKYLRGTEKMLSKLKQELQRVKTENAEVKKKFEKVKEEQQKSAEKEASGANAETEKLRSELAAVQANLKTSVTELEGKLNSVQDQLKNTETELLKTKDQHTAAQKEISTLSASHEKTRSDFDRLQKENALLEERAKDAEDKVQLLLDQVEHSVDNYRRQSRLSHTGAPQLNGSGVAGHVRNISNASHSNNLKTHSRSTSDGGDSTYDDAHADSASNAGDDSRNSLALDSLASELESLRSHWETTKNYRLSDHSGLASWRHASGRDSNSHDDHSSVDGGTVKGDGDSGRPSTEHADDARTPTTVNTKSTPVAQVSGMLGGMI